MDEILLPAVPDHVYRLYESMRDAPRLYLARDVLPAGKAALETYFTLDRALNDASDTTFGAYREAVKNYHDLRIAPVAPAIEGMKEYINALIQIAYGVDQGSIAITGETVLQLRCRYIQKASRIQNERMQTLLA